MKANISTRIELTVMRAMKLALFIIGTFLVSYDAICQRSATGFHCEFFGDSKNQVSDGPWFGLLKCKLISTDQGTFTFTMPVDKMAGTVILMHRKTDGLWTNGAEIISSRPPVMMMDSQNRIHVIAHEPFDRNNEADGRLYHLKFKEPFDIEGEYEKQYVVEDWRSPEFASSYCSYYYGALLTANDDIFVAFASSHLNSARHSVSLANYVDQSKQWNVRRIADSLDSRYCYPGLLFDRNQLHIVLTEDKYSLTLQETGYPFRYGKVLYIHGADSIGWTSNVIYDLTDSYTDQQIQNLKLQVADVQLDKDGGVHVLIRENRKRKHTNLKLINLSEAQAPEIIALNSHRFPLARLIALDDRLAVMGIVPTSGKLQLVEIERKRKVDLGIRMLKNSDPVFFLSDRYGKKPTVDNFELVIFDGRRPEYAEFIRKHSITSSLAFN